MGLMENRNINWGKLSAEWDNTEEFVVYGFGEFARVYFDNLCTHIHIRFIIDNSENIKGKFYKGIPIFAFEEAKKQIGKTKIIIMAETIAYNQIINDLKKNGYLENIDFVGLERFICEWFFKRLRKIYLMEVHTTITTVCTFNCKKCNMFIPFYKSRRQYSSEELKKNIDTLFQHIDYLFKYQLVGGEPFLNKDLPEFLLYVNEKYANRIGKIRIITNGGVVPSKSLLCAIKESKAEVSVSNYLNAINYQEKFEQVISCFDKCGIDYKIISTLHWRDFGFPDKPFIRTKEEGKRHMQICGTSWHGLNGGRLYYCNSAWSASECGLYTNLETDYVNLMKSENEIESRISLLEFCLGDKENEYNSFCRICGGCGEDNKSIIIAGEQV